MADVVKNTEGPWNNKQFKKMSVTFNRKDKQRKVIPRSPDRTIFIGRKWVRSTQLYLKYIDRQGGTDDEVCRLVKEYAKDIGIQVMTADVISNRYDPEMVGYRIRVPNDEVELALENGTWLDVVECRKWSKGKPTRDMHQKIGEENTFNRLILPRTEYLERISLAFTLTNNNDLDLEHMAHVLTNYCQTILNKLRQ